MSSVRHRSYRYRDTQFEVAITPSGQNAVTVAEGDRTATFGVVRLDDTTFEIEADGRRLTGYACREGRNVWIHYQGRVWVLERVEAGRQGAAHHGPTDHRILAPMTGTVQQVRVAVGDSVSAGDPMVVLEAMKMEHVLRAPRDGVVDAVNCQDGEQVEAQVVLASLADESPETDLGDIDTLETESSP